jgi:hypothetical protein
VARGPNLGPSRHFKWPARNKSTNIFSLTFYWQEYNENYFNYFFFNISLLFNFLYHVNSIIYKEALCAKDIDFNHVISPVVRCVSMIRSHSTEENLGNFLKKKSMNMVNLYYTSQSDAFPRESQSYISTPHPFKWKY